MLKAVDIANSTGNPTLKMVEDILLQGPGRSSAGLDGLDRELLEDEYHVERRDPSDYDVLWDIPDK